MNTMRCRMWVICIASLAFLVIVFAYRKMVVTKHEEPLHEEPLNKKDAYYKTRHTSDERLKIDKKFVIVREQLLRAHTQQEYDILLPVFCELSARRRYALDWGDYYDFCLQLDTDLSRGPLMQILKGKDVVKISFAAFLVGVQKQHGVTSLLIEWLTTKFDGEELPDYQATFNTGSIIRSLCALASDGDETAVHFLGATGFVGGFLIERVAGSC